MRVGVLTFHGSINPGAFWQTFATCQLLQSMGHDPEVVNYLHAVRHRRNPFFPAMKLRAWLRPDFVMQSVAKNLIAATARKSLPLGPIVDQRDDLARIHYDAVCIGSDVVWERPIDPAYLGCGLNTDRVIAYAASAGGVEADVGDVPEELSARCPFSAISVRDQNSIKLLMRGHASWNSGVCLISDPTVTLQIPGMGKRSPLKRPYLMIYCSNALPADFKSEIKSYAKAHDLQVVSVFYRQRGFNNHLLVDAYDWMNFLSHASGVVTDTFHGSVISCLTSRPLAVVNMKKKTLLKSTDQFEKLSIHTRLCWDANSIAGALSLEWEKEGEVRKRCIKENRDFLSRALLG